MIRGGVTFASAAFVRQFQQASVQRVERACLVATDKAARNAKEEIRSAMRSAGLGRLPNVIASTSDLAKRGAVFRKGRGFSAQGVVFVRGKSERTLGAIEAYTEGADIAPRKGQWLWLASKDLPARVGRYRMTPELYVRSGSPLGPLTFVPGRHPGEALLIAKNVTVNRFGKGRSARRLPKRGRIGETRELRETLVAFVGIRRTSRGARVDARTIIRLNAESLPILLAAELKN